MNRKGKGTNPSRLLRSLRSQKGGLMLELTIVLAVLGTLGGALSTGLQTSYISKRQFEIQSEAENIVRNQMEHVFEQAYVSPPGFYATITPPPTYSVVAEAQVYNATSSNIERVIVTVIKEGRTVNVVETLRSNR